MKKGYELLAIVIVLYTFTLIYLMFFGCGRAPSDIGSYQFTLLKTIKKFCLSDNIKTYDFIVNILGNVFVFAPYGFLGILFRPLKKFLIITPAFLIMISVLEFFQYFTGRGIADVDDVFLNTLGCSLGFLVYRKMELLLSIPTSFVVKKFQNVYRL